MKKTAKQLSPSLHYIAQNEMLRFLSKNPFNISEKDKKELHKFEDLFVNQETKKVTDESVNEMHAQAEHDYGVLSLQIAEYKKTIPDQQFRNAFRAFKKLSVNGEATSSRYQKEVASYYITQDSLVTNFEKLFNFKCDIFAKILYLNMSRNKDAAKISFMQFVSVFEGLVSDSPRDAPNKCIFRLLDVRNEGHLTIIYLL